MFPQAFRNILSALVLAGAVLAQDSGTGGLGTFQFHGYDTINAYSFDWDTDPSRRARNLDAIDRATLVMFLQSL